VEERREDFLAGLEQRLLLTCKKGRAKDTARGFERTVGLDSGS